MNILVTGGAGYIGSHTCLALIEAGHTTVVADNLCNSSRESIQRVKELTQAEIPFYQFDLRDEEALSQVFRQNTIDVVIHFAGLKAVGESVTQPVEYYENNLGATLSLCRVMTRFGVKRLVYSSSATVYSAENVMPLDENSRVGGCTNPYGWSKYMCEQILKDIAAADSEWSVALLRYFNPVGAHASGKIGEAPNGVPRNLMPYITQTAVGKQTHVKVFGGDYPTRDGTGVRDYIHVSDVADGHVAVLNYLMKHNGIEVFNLGTGQGYSVLDLIKTFERVNQVPVPYVITDRRPGDVADSWADSSKSERLLGWKAQKGLEDMCRDAWRWQQMNPNGFEK